MQFLNNLKKSQLIENIAKVAKEKIIDGISELRDESNREGVRIVIDLKRYSKSLIPYLAAISILCIRDGSFLM